MPQFVRISDYDLQGGIVSESYYVEKSVFEKIKGILNGEGIPLVLPVEEKR